MWQVSDSRSMLFWACQGSWTAELLLAGPTWPLSALQPVFSHVDLLTVISCSAHQLQAVLCQYEAPCASLLRGVSLAFSHLMATSLNCGVLAMDTSPNAPSAMLPSWITASCTTGAILAALPQMKLNGALD